ncbi:hypothetical protein ACM66B_002185 [Microbotryomycetes sp. NB124-2]
MSQDDELMPHSAGAGAPAQKCLVERLPTLAFTGLTFTYCATPQPRRTAATVTKWGPKLTLGQSTSAVKVTAQDRAILDLKLQRDKLKQYQKRVSVIDFCAGGLELTAAGTLAPRRQIDTVLTREREIAKQALAAGNKQRALIALRQRKYQENLLAQTDSQLETLQKLVASIEFSLVEKDVLFGLQQGNQVLKQLNAEMDLNKIEKLMSDTAEGVEYQREVSAMLSSTMSAADEEDVLEQLAQLQAEQVNMPSVPTSALPQTETTPLEGESRDEEPTRVRQMVPA